MFSYIYIYKYLNVIILWPEIDFCNFSSVKFMKTCFISQQIIYLNDCTFTEWNESTWFSCWLEYYVHITEIWLAEGSISTSCSSHHLSSLLFLKFLRKERYNLNDGLLSPLQFASFWFMLLETLKECTLKVTLSIIYCDFMSF